MFGHPYNQAAGRDALRDVQYGLRQLRKSPGFAAVAILTLAIGIGSTTSIFSFVNAVLLRPLPYPRADRLAIIWSGLGYSNRAPFSSYELFQIRQRTNEFDQVGGIWVTNSTLPGDEQAEQIKAGAVTSNFLPLLCAQPALGRFFTSEDEVTRAQRPLILSHAVWARRFGSDPTIIGRSIRFGTSTGLVVGVLPESFRLLFPNDASVPANVDVFYAIQANEADPEGPAFLHLIGRLREGTTVARAQAEADGIARGVNSLNGRQALSKFRIYVFSFHEDEVRSIRNSLLILFGGVVLVLLIACANVANLLMERAGQRTREVSIRMALGASRVRLLRQFLTESLTLAFLGSFAALALGWACVHAILAAEPPSLVNFSDVSVDARAMAFTFSVAMLTSMFFGLLPALSAGRVKLAHSLKEAGRSAGWNRQYGTTMLISCEVALAFVLLVGTGLLTSTFINVLRIDPGFRAQNVYTLRLSGAGDQMLRQLQQNVGAVPGVQSVSAVSHLPLDDMGNWYDYYWKEDTPPELQNTAMADLRSILPGYFNTIGATLIRGRDFTPSDDSSHQHVAIIDDVIAQGLWLGEDAVGKKLNVSDSPDGPYQFQRDWVLVVGIVRHVQYHSLTSIVRPQVYLPFRLAPRPNMAMVVRSGGPPADLASAVRKQVGQLNKNVALSRLEPLSLLVKRALAGTGFASLLATLLSVVAMLLASIGIYGMLSYSIARRTSEIGIRIALGASRRHVTRAVLADALVSVCGGISAGFLLSLAVVPVFSRLLYGVKPYNPINYAVILVVILLVSAVAVAIPVRRALRTDPLIALRYE